MDDIYLGLDENNFLNVTSLSNYTYWDSITKKTSINELNEIKHLFNRMINSSEELSEFISNKTIKYNLDYDYGMGDIRICSEVNNVIEWHVDLK